MIRSAAWLIRAKGVSGTGLREIVEHAGAPRGSLQHYFPGGKDQLVTEALLLSGRAAARRARRLADELDPATPSTLLAGLCGQWRELLLTEGFAAGCPLVAAAADVAGTSAALREAVDQAFAGWQAPVADALHEMGVPSDRAASLAWLILSALEGAIVLCRARRDIAPLETLACELGPALDAAVSRRRRRAPGAPLARGTPNSHLGAAE